MAENKKSFIAYTDWIDVFEELDDGEAGKLVKHLFRYVNDLNPHTDDKIVKMCFIQMRHALKRDLEKYGEKKESDSKSGKIGNLKRWHKDLYDKFINKELTLDDAMKIAHDRKTSPPDKTESPPVGEIAVSVSVSVSDSDSDSDSDSEKTKNVILLSQVDKSTLDHKALTYYEIAISFMELFKSNLIELNMPTKTLESAKYLTWVNPIRLLTEIDKRTVEEFREVFQFLKSDDFWKQQIRSTEKLRKKDKEGISYFETLLGKSRNEEKRKSTSKESNSGATDAYKQSIYNRLHGIKSDEEMPQS